MAFTVLYVDDMLIGSNDPEKLKEIKSHLNKVFEIKDLGEPKSFLGMRINRNRQLQKIQIDQEEYAEKILERFKRADCNPKDTPMYTVKNMKDKLKKGKNAECRKDQIQGVPYREAVGSLLHLAGGTRPDISYAVNVLSRRQVNPTNKDWEDVKSVLQYIRRTTKLGLVYKGKNDCLEEKTDTSFSDWNDNTSTSGYVISLFGDTIAWQSHKQLTVYT